MGIKKVYNLDKKDSDGKPIKLPGGSYFCYRCSALVSKRPFESRVECCPKCGCTMVFSIS